jgi:ribonuclease E
MGSAVEPPAAPAPAPVQAPAPYVAPAVAAPAEPAPPAPSERREDLPIEAQLVRMGLLTLEQLAEANRTRLESGGTVAEIAVANGWVTPEQLAVLSGGAPAPVLPPPPAPEPEIAPQLRVAEVEAAPAPAPVAAAPVVEAPVAVVPPAPVAATYRVALHLNGGERVEVAAAPDEATAQQRAREIVFDLTRPRADEWPFYGGRFVRPDAILSVDVVAD